MNRLDPWLNRKNATVAVATFPQRESASSAGYQHARDPPSITQFAPVTKAASGLDR